MFTMHQFLSKRSYYPFGSSNSIISRFRFTLSLRLSEFQYHFMNYECIVVESCSFFLSSSHYLPFLWLYFVSFPLSFIFEKDQLQELRLWVLPETLSSLRNCNFYSENRDTRRTMGTVVLHLRTAAADRINIYTYLYINPLLLVLK